ncbi:MAG: hypothetical protein JWN46_2087 [Acidimicrobiales bacterium]|nr:hypothetical protein [Acidimicrobiales bacterium]
MSPDDAAPEDPGSSAPLRPRTVSPRTDRGAGPATPIRPRTVPPMGRPVPMLAAPLEVVGDATYAPPTSQIPVLSDADVPLSEDTTAGGGLPSTTALVRSNLAVASGTAVSRATGLLRTFVLVWALQKALADTYLLANNTPNIIFELILGGVLSATLVPIFTEDLELGDDSATSAVVSFSLVALVVLTGFAFLATPALMALYASNASDTVSSGQFRSVGIRLAFLFAPQVFFYGVMAIGAALLNARRRFFAAAWAPVLNNIVVISVLVSVTIWFDHAPTLGDASHNTKLMLVLGLGTTLGIVAMSLALLPALRRAGVHVKFRPSMKHPAVRRAVRLSFWTFGYVIANQVAAQVVNVLAEPGSGGVRDYQVAFQFFQLPHGLLAVSIMTTLEPELARAASRLDFPAFSARMLLGLRLTAVLVLPAAVGLLAVPLGTVVPAAHQAAANHAALLHPAAHWTNPFGSFAEIGRITAAFAIGLLGFSTFLFVLRGFYALKDTKTPFLINCVENVINIVLAVALVGRYEIVGLALSWGIAYSISAVIALVILTRRTGSFDMGGLISSYTKLLIAAGAMGAAVWGVGRLVIAPSRSRVGLAVAASVAVGAVVYVAGVIALRVPGIDELMDRLRRRRAGPGAASERA